MMTSDLSRKEVNFESMIFWVSLLSFSLSMMSSGLPLQYRVVISSAETTTLKSFLSMWKLLMPTQ